MFRRTSFGSPGQTLGSTRAARAGASRRLARDTGRCHKRPEQQLVPGTVRRRDLLAFEGGRSTAGRACPSGRAGSEEVAQTGLCLPAVLVEGE